MKTDLPIVSVVLPVFNDRQRLATCLESLETQTYPKDCYEVIVVDNASTIDLKEVVDKFRQASYFYEGRPGSYAARNKGLTVATGAIIAFTDSDCIPASDWIERGVSVLQKNPEYGLVGGVITLFFKNPERLTGVELYESLKGFPQQEYIEQSHFGATANVFTTRKILDAVGNFNADLQSGGDAEWGKRVAKAGYRLHYADDVRVAHPARSTYSEYYKKIIRVMSGLPAFRKPEPVPFTAIIKQLIRGIKPPVSRIRRTLAEAKVKGIGQSMKLTIFILFLHYVWVFQQARLNINK